MQVLSWFNWQTTDEDIKKFLDQVKKVSDLSKILIIDSRLLQIPGNSRLNNFAMGDLIMILQNCIVFVKMAL